MVNFDFTGTIDVRVSYNAAPLTSYEIRPSSYAIAGTQSSNTVTFPLTQNTDAPRKLVFRANGSWEGATLHLLTNPLEVNAPDPSAANVFTVQPGQEAPLQLPQGKDTYYFAAGEHTLPRGMWAEFDLGAEYPLDRIQLAQSTFQIGIGMTPTAYPNKYTVETKRAASDPYTLAVDGRSNTQTGEVTNTFTPRAARYIRVKLLGSATATGFQFSNAVSEFRAFAGSSGNLAQGRAAAGAMPNFATIADGSTTSAYASESGYGNWHSGETFFIRESSTVYLAPGSLVHGAFGSDGISNITIRGRGILDGSTLTHDVAGQGEVRTGSIWLTGGSDNTVEGITILDPTMWTVVMNFATRPKVKNINILAYEVNADGIHFSGSSDGLVSGVFIRTPDDNIVMYHYGTGRRNVFTNSVFWGDDAHIFLFGLGTVPNAEISDITVSNSDVLNQQGVYDLDKFNGVMKVWPNGNNHTSNITFSNIRIDSFRDPSKAVVFQLRSDERFAGEGGGTISNVTLSGIQVNGTGERASTIAGTGAITGVQIAGYTRAGATVSNPTNGNFAISGLVSDVKVNGTNIPTGPPSSLRNTSFEAPSMPGSFQYTPSGSEWTYFREAGIASNGSLFGVGLYGAANAPDGSQVGFVQKRGRLEQSFGSAPVGASYRVRFSLAARPGDAAPQTVKVTFDNVLLGSYTPGSTSYVEFTTPPITQGGGTHTIGFEGTTDADRTAFIDRVSVIPG
ncbi:hypothetical protein AWU67_16590 [Microterricola viridarii]|uniref:F5/8 type C domain-containing protein n=2 Tax=Microterricola viridarii TaxID=412690 RepID=A0A0Y0PJW6_9MICO|nr:hypothetical protein AWU67_16590 [Microterricola viridarii]